MLALTSYCRELVDCIFDIGRERHVAADIGETNVFQRLRVMLHVETDIVDSSVLERDVRSEFFKLLIQARFESRLEDE